MNGNGRPGICRPDPLFLFAYKRSPDPMYHLHDVIIGILHRLSAWRISATEVM